MNILIYDAFFHVVNGASKYILFVADKLAEDNDVVLLGDKDFSCGIIEKIYGFKMGKFKTKILSFKSHSAIGKRIIGNWEHIRRCEKVSEISKSYDLFINNVGGFCFQIKPQAGKNLMIVYFLMDPYHSFRYHERFKKIKNLARKVFLPPPGKHNFISHYDKIACVSEFTKKWILKLWGKEDVDIINPPVRWSEDCNAQKEDIILSVARFNAPGPDGDGKGRDKMIRAFKIICDEDKRDLRLILAGGVVEGKGTDEYICRLKEMSRGYNVKFYFDLEEAELNRIYSKAKIFWHLAGLGVDEEKRPERLEPFGMVTAEAMSHGVVPIAANTGGQKEIINDGGSGFLVDTIDELIEKTKFLTDNEDEWKNFSKRAKERSKVFGLDRFYRQWQEVCLKFRS
ncbi:MAG: hypothetical protein A2987_03860 [Omnitrophica bacterium RIFCSPLOWO2_01_FULL_45_10]|nr:MAG: hypothetical protein A2987_03860 [Omnitrophica bacterium RIFCSPLOWO2_01_FULL_45_10]